MQSIFKLRRFLEPPPQKCELCGAAVESTHQHIVDVENRRLMCTCRPCYLLFQHHGSAGGKLRSVSDRFLNLPPIEIPGEEIPVSVVFFIRDSVTSRVTAFYPSPAGATEAAIAQETWKEMLEKTPALATLEPDIEALLVCKHESWILPVDACYELVGRIKRSWRGAESQREIGDFFENLRGTAA